VIELSYKLKPENLASYQFAVRNRIKHTPGVWWKSLTAQILTTFALVACIALLIVTVFPRLGLGTFHPMSALAGFLIGGLFTVVANWLHYFSARDRIVRPDGPTFSAHTMMVEDSGLTVKSARGESRYKWSLFDAVTERSDIIVLWYEPAGGIIVPHAAFETPAAATAFVDFVSTRITARG
jgi:YcxB-like protein